MHYISIKDSAALESDSVTTTCCMVKELEDPENQLRDGDLESFIEDFMECDSPRSVTARISSSDSRDSHSRDSRDSQDSQSIPAMDVLALVASRFSAIDRKYQITKNAK
jgi:hypothetical protein